MTATRSGRPDRTTLALLLLIAALGLLLPRSLSLLLAIPRAAGWIGLGNLAVLVITHQLGWRWGLGSGWALGVMASLAVLCQGRPIAAGLLMAFCAFSLGITARWRAQGVLVLLMVSQCFVLAESPVAPRPADLLAFGGLMTLLTSITALATSWVERRGGCQPPPLQVGHTRVRSLAYGLLLAATTASTTAIALTQHWALMGGWLMLTPLMVMRPHARDSLPRSLHRALGTLLGVGMVHLLAMAAPTALTSPVVAVLFSAFAVLAAVRTWPHALFVVFLTGAVVLFHSPGDSVLALAQERLEANLLGIGIGLGVMVLVEFGFRLRPSAPDPNPGG